MNPLHSSRTHARGGACASRDRRVGVADGARRCRVAVALRSPIGRLPVASGPETRYRV